MPTIPLKPNSKLPACKGWNARAPAEQWQDVPDAANIGGITGNGRVVADGDSPAAVAGLQAWFDGLGLQPVPVLTQSGNCQFWFRADVPASETRTSIRLPAELPGELRLRANCVVPCSTIQGRAYRLADEARGPELLASMRVLSWHDIEWLVAPPAVYGAILDAPPIKLLPRGTSPEITSLLESLRIASPGRAVGRYASRSDAEAAVVAGLILCGRSYESISDTFERYRPGHYWQLGPRRGSYLAFTYRNALSRLAASSERPAIAAAWQAAMSASWAGRAGLADMWVYCGILASCWVACGWQAHASERDLAEYGGLGDATVHRALARLRGAGLVKRVQAGIGMLAPRWEAFAIVEHTSCSGGSWGNSSGQLQTREGQPAAAWEPLLGAPAAAAVVLAEHCELWAKLGRSAGAIYGQLGPEPRTPAALVVASGRALRTVYRALGILQANGLAEPVDGGWVRGPAELAEVADDWKTDKAAKQRRWAHQREREAWAEQQPDAGDDGQEDATWYG